MRFGGAALGVDVASFIGDAATPKFGLMGEQGIAEDAKNHSLSFGLSSEMANAGTAAHGMVSVANAQKGAIEAGGDARFAQGLAGGIGSMVQGIAGGLGSPTGGGTTGKTMPTYGGQTYSGFLGTDHGIKGFAPTMAFKSNIFGG